MIEFIKENFIWIAGIFTAVKWTYEYSQKLKWDRSKILLERLEDFLQRESTEKVHHLLDWNSLVLDINGESTMINDKMLLEALTTHDKKMQYTRIELELRDLFDEYFDGLTEFLILSECGLLSKRDFSKFMSYWFEILNGRSKRKPEELHLQIESYMVFYGFQRLHKFIHKKPLFPWLNL